MENPCNYIDCIEVTKAYFEITCLAGVERGGKGGKRKRGLGREGRTLSQSLTAKIWNSIAPNVRKENKFAMSIKPK